MAADTSRSPSPAAAPPIEATPGPRAATLLKLYEEAITHTLNVCDYEKFAKCFPTTAENRPDALQNLHKEFIFHLGERFRKEFEITLRERNVVPALNDLDRLVERARRRKAKAEAGANGGAVQPPTPPHTLPAKSLYMAHLNPVLQSRQDGLETQLQQLQSENAGLAETLTKQRGEINQVISSIEAVVSDLDSSLQALPVEQAQALTKDAVDLDVEMRADGD